MQALELLLTGLESCSHAAHIMPAGVMVRLSRLISKKNPLTSDLAFVKLIGGLVE